MKPLILYYSYSGNNELLARHLASRLDCRVEAIVEKKKRRPVTILLDMALKRRPAIEEIWASPAEFDHVLLLAPLWNMGIAHPMVSAIRQIAGRLPNYSFVTLCGYDRPGQNERVRRELEELTGKAPMNVWELTVAELVPLVERANVRVVSRRCVRAHELEAFSDRIDQIVDALEPAEAGSPPPGSHAA